MLIVMESYHVKEVILSISHPPDIYLFKVNNRNTRKKSEIWPKLTIKTPKRRH